MNEFISSSKQNLIRRAIQSGLREDGRQIFNFRSLQLLFNREQDSVEVSLGQTKVSAHIEATVTEPRIDRQSEGFLNFKVDLTTLQSTYSFQQVKEKNDEIIKILEKTIKGSK